MTMPEQSDSIRILLVDDDENLRDIVCSMIKKGMGNVEVRPAVTLGEAREILKNEGFDCALVDYRLPDGKGISLIRELKEKRKDPIPTILLTAKGSEQLAVDIMKEGARSYISKSDMTPDLLCRSIQEAIHEHRMEQVLAERTRQLLDANRQLEEANIKLKDLARLDPLTEVFNRRGFQEILTRECQYAAREGHHFIVLLVDLDNFKQVNDAIGHDAGDLILREVARRLRDSLRATDYVARVGGDEFMVLLPKTRPSEGVEVAQKIRRAVSETILYKTGTISVTVSIGLAMVKQAVQSIDELLVKTHLALIKSKELGKNRVTFDEDEEDPRWQTEAPFVQALDLLRRGEGLSIAQQPIFKIDSLQIVGYELFTRSQIAGFEMPDDFFHLAAEANILSLVDRLCFEKCVLSTPSFEPGLQYHINLFPATLLSVSVQEFLTVFSPQRPKENYCIELSERQFVGNTLDLVRAVSDIQAEGVLVAVDDVGFGHTFLESLLLLNPDRIKIDRNCTSGVAHDKSKRCSLERLLKIVRTFGCDVIVKGVDSEADFNVLKGLDVQLGQGYLLKNRV